MEAAHERELLGLAAKLNRGKISISHKGSENTCKICGAAFSFSDKRKQLEVSWIKAVESESNQRISSLRIPDDNLCSMNVSLTSLGYVS